MVRVYISGKFSDKEMIKTYMTQLQKFGHTITHDWTSYVSDSSNRAFKNVEGVAFSEVVVIFMTDPKYSYRETFTELGASLGLLKEIYIICPDKNSDCMTNVFFHHPSISHIDSWEEFLTCLSVFNV